jgi:hypothetical protein
MRHARTTLPTVLTILTAGLAAAAPLKREEVPAPLQPWISWVLRGSEAETCPFFQGQGGGRCAWPGALKLTLDKSGGRFEQSWRLDAEDWVPLPGGTEHWPQDVRVDGAPAVVVERGGAPNLRLKSGTHALSGAFRWTRAPEQLDIPSDVGLLALTVDGKPAPFPLRDESGRLWLQTQARAAAPREESHLEVTVHRRLVDDVPLQVVTRLQLKVSGANRELALGRPLPEGFAPMSLVSPLPARLDPDGRLRVQLRAGAWEVLLVSRREGAGDEIKLPAPGGAWAADEAWVFEARPDLRQAEVEGAPSLDPQQTELPQDWKALPAYLVKPGTGLRLVQRRRGDDPPEPDRLSLRRELWLDFDGAGLSARDRIEGTLARSWRLEVSPEMKLGRVSAGGSDQFLTALSSGGPAGLEVRTRRVDVTADSRIEGRRLTAAGWRHDFESVSGVLHVPPGWRVVHVSGADQASPTWVTAWTLLDFFLVLVASAAFLKLYGPRWGAAALAGLALLWHEPDAPRWIWLAALLLAALDKVLVDRPTPARWVGLIRRATWVVLALICVPFLVKQIRVGVYPTLERPYDSIAPRAGEQQVSEEGRDESLDEEGAAQSFESSNRLKERRSRAFDGGRAGGGGNLPAIAAMAAPAGAPEPMEEEKDEEPAEADASSVSVAGGVSYGAALSSLRKAPAPKAAPSFYSQVLTQMRLDPQARVNTGPGLPYWTWNSVRLTWKGPVPKDHPLRLWLISPCVNLILALLRCALTVLLALIVGWWPVGAWLESLRGADGWRRAARAVLPLLLLAALGARASAAEGGFPPKDLLDQLKARLLEKPECAPECAASPLLRVEATPSWLKLKLAVHAAAATAVPVPTGGREWTPARGLLDGNPAPAARAADGTLWVPVPAGAHELTLEGPLPERDTVQIALPLKPRRVEASVAGWTLGGVREDGRAEDALQLSRARGAEPAAVAAARAQGLFPPFLRVERTVRLGLSWSVETRVVRLTPTGSPVVVQIPLLPGESVTSSDMRVAGGKITVSLSPQAEAASWSSVLQESASLALAAPAAAQWTEAWTIEPGPLWHVEASGLPAVYQEPDAGARSLSYRPWPGESLKLAITRPGAVVGQTLTVDQSALSLAPGVRATDASLSLRLRTSRGDKQTLLLPKDADLLGVKIDGAAQPLRLEGSTLSIPVSPGAHSVEVDWRQQGGERAFLRAPVIGLGAPSVNAHVLIAMPADRWILFAGGRGLGPAVLFWSLLAVFLIASVGLAKTGLAPLSWSQWLLLSLGLTQLPVARAAVVAGWFLAVGLRALHPPAGRREFNAAQVFLAFYTAVAAALLFSAIKHGLLGSPQMQIAGNGSGAGALRWYVDRAGETTPRPWVFSVPLYVYRGAMLVWALWLADSLMTWSRWAWKSYSDGGLWRPKA